MAKLDETEISKTILNSYHEILLERIVNDVIIVGAGPAGLVAGFYLARQGAKVTVLEKRLAPGGGIWGGGMGMNVAVVQQEAIPVLDEMSIRYKPKSDWLVRGRRDRVGSRAVLERRTRRRGRLESRGCRGSMRASRASDRRGGQPHDDLRRAAGGPDRLGRPGRGGCHGARIRPGCGLAQARISCHP